MDGDRENSEPENLGTICANCHRLYTKMGYGKFPAFFNLPDSRRVYASRKKPAASTPAVHPSRARPSVFSNTLVFIEKVARPGRFELPTLCLEVA
jgi:hypothetical protein